MSVGWLGEQLCGALRGERERQSIGGNTFCHIIVNRQLVVFTPPDHSDRVPLVVIQFLSRVQSLWSLA